MMAKKFAAAAAYGVLLAAFTGYVMLDAFVLAKPAQTGAGGVNLSMFAEETGTAEAGASAAESTAASEQPETTPALVAGSAIPIGTAVPSESTVQQVSDAEPETDAAPESASETETEIETETEPAQQEVTFVSSDTVYQDENIQISLNTYKEYNTVIYVADVQVSSAQYLKTAFAQDTYGRNITAATSEIAESKNAILAINGDFYGTRDSGYVIRNGVIYRSSGSADTDVLCVMTDGSFMITNSGEYSAQELLELGAWQAFSFGPALVESGAVTVSEYQEVGRAMASNPRTALGIIDNLHYLFVVSDGRTNESEGLSLYELADFMQRLGVQTAYNLDGGGSSTMYFNGSVINNPTTNGNRIKERSVSDIVCIGY